MTVCWWDDGVVLALMGYRFAARPRRVVGDPHAEGVNCRSLIQDYFWDQHSFWLGRDAIEQPGLWEKTGVFVDVVGGDDVARLASLPHETILLAERIRNAAGEPLARGPERFDTVEDYRFRLHTGLLLRPEAIDLDALCGEAVPRCELVPGEPVVFHATAVQNSTCLWGLHRFTHYYRLVAAKKLTTAQGRFTGDDQ